MYTVKKKIGGIDVPPSVTNLLRKVRTETQTPALCWIWPGPFGRRYLPIHRTKSGTPSVAKTIVEAFNGPIPIHPHNGRPTHFVQACCITRECVNPFHVRVLRKKDLWELDVPYEQVRFYFPHELENMDPEFVEYLRDRGLAAQDQAKTQPPLPI